MKKYLDKSLSALERAKALVDEMTVEEQAGQLRYDAPSVPRLGIPAYNWWNEGLHGLARSGVATMFPQAIGMAAMFDTELVEMAGDITPPRRGQNTTLTQNTMTGTFTRDLLSGLPTSTFSETRDGAEVMRLMAKTLSLQPKTARHM